MLEGCALLLDLVAKGLTAFEFPGLEELTTLLFDCITPLLCTAGGFAPLFVIDFLSRFDGSDVADTKLSSLEKESSLKVLLLERPGGGSNLLDEIGFLPAIIAFIASNFAFASSVRFANAAFSFSLSIFSFSASRCFDASFRLARSLSRRERLLSRSLDRKSTALPVPDPVAGG